MRPTSFAPILDTLTKQRGVSAALVVSERDGIVVDSNLQIGQSGDRVAALAASLYRKARFSAQAAGMGAVSFMTLEAPKGRLCAAGTAAGELVLVVVAEAAVNVGLVRVEMLKAVGGLAGAAGLDDGARGGT
jgi:predicted regulator of Ras-like GTPase activity (Roadblock/LC7/MglB family)